MNICYQKKLLARNSRNIFIRYYYEHNIWQSGRRFQIHEYPVYLTWIATMIKCKYQMLLSSVKQVGKNIHNSLPHQSLPQAWQGPISYKSCCTTLWWQIISAVGLYLCHGDTIMFYEMEPRLCLICHITASATCQKRAYHQHDQCIIYTDGIHHITAYKFEFIHRASTSDCLLHDLPHCH